MRVARNPLTLAIAVSLWVASVGNWPLWRAMVKLSALSFVQGTVFITSLCVMMACFSLTLLALGAWQRTIKPLATLVLVVSAADAHYMGTHPFVIDSSMMINVLDSNVYEDNALIGWGLLVSMAVLAGLPSWWLWRTPLRPMPASDQSLHNAAALVLSLFLAGALLVLNAAPIFLNVRNHKKLHSLINPLLSVYAHSGILPQMGATSGPASRHPNPRADDPAL